jgi:hypothetical protein
MADENFNPQLDQDYDTVAEVKDAALSQLSKSENIADYVAERNDQAREERGERADTKERYVRIKTAIERARAETAEARQQAGL